MTEIIQTYKTYFWEIILLQYMKMMIFRNNKLGISHNCTVHKLIIIRI